MARGLSRAAKSHFAPPLCFGEGAGGEVLVRNLLPRYRVELPVIETQQENGDYVLTTRIPSTVIPIYVQ